MKRDGYPLQWPEGWKRTPFHERGRPKFASHFVEDRDAIIRRLERRRGANIVITSWLPRNAHGLPIPGPVEDPAIAVYWIERQVERVLACDQWQRVSENLRAIAKTLEALDGIARWGASQIVERAFAGFAALPPGASSSIPTGPVKRPWREVLGGAWPHELDNASTLAIAKSRHRAAIALAHPDRGGSADDAAALNVALGEAETELA